MQYGIEDFNYLDRAFEEAKEPVSRGDIPDGKYIVRVDSVEVKTSEKGNLYLGWNLVILDGEYEGARLYYLNMIPDRDDENADNKLGFFKKALRTAGINVDAFNFEISDFLTNRLNELLDIVLEVNLKTKKDRDGNDQQNSYISRRLSSISPDQDN